jgi:uracil-DNA glycosylase family 4
MTMALESLSEELLSLTEQAREHALFLRELGVESFAGPANERRDLATNDEVPAAVSHNAEKREKEQTDPQSLPQISQAAVPKPAVVTRAANTLFANVFEPPKESLPESAETFEQIWAEVGNCTRCPLAEGRTHIVHTEGNRKARLMFVGEAPGADEDAQARPFVGRAGQLLTKIIEAIGFKREDVLIGNINRCRPPGNRAPTPDEVLMCKPFLLREIAAARPDVIVVMGNTAMKNLLDIKEGISRVRGQFQNYKGVRVMPTFHPAYLLRDPSKKRETWEDLKKVRDYLDSTPRKEV